MAALLWRRHIPELVAKLIVSLDGFARSRRSPGYYGYSGPNFDAWIETNTAIPHRMLIGRRTYELLAGLRGKLRDDGWRTMRNGV